MQVRDFSACFGRISRNETGINSRYLEPSPRVKGPKNIFLEGGGEGDREILKKNCLHDLKRQNILFANDLVW